MKTKRIITGKFNFPEVNVSYIEGEDSGPLFDELRGDGVYGIKMEGVKSLFLGSSTLIAAAIDRRVREINRGIRAANLRDLSRPEVMKMIKGKHYSDAAALVLRAENDDYEPNQPLIRRLLPWVEEELGTLRLPVLVTGFDFTDFGARNGYALNIVKRNDFAALHDERLSREGKFSTVDEYGLPNFDRDGNRCWMMPREGLSRVYLNPKLDIHFVYGSDIGVTGNIEDSNPNGRIILVKDKAA